MCRCRPTRRVLPVVDTLRIASSASQKRHGTMFNLPTYFWPFLFAAIAALAGWHLSGRPGDDPGSFPGWILYAVALGCVVIGVAAIWLTHNA